MSKTIAERMHEALPELLEHKRISGELRRYKRLVPSASTTHQLEAEQQVKDRMLELITAGQEVPADVARPILEAKKLDELFDLRSQALNRLARSVETSAENAMADNADDTTAFLRSELSRVVAEVRALKPDLNRITSAEQAIAAGSPAVAAWQLVTRCVEDYDEIRQIQFQLAESSDDRLIMNNFLSTGILADAIDVQGSWVSRRKTNAAAEKHEPLTGAGAEYQKWLTAALPKRTFDYKDRWWQDGESKVEHLLRLVSEATPWLPSSEDLRQSRQYALDATEQVTVNVPQQWEVARRAYYNLTGARPKVKLPEAPTFVRNTAPYSQPTKLAEKISNARERSFAENARRSVPGLGQTHD